MYIYIYIYIYLLIHLCFGSAPAGCEHVGCEHAHCAHSGREVAARATHSCGPLTVTPFWLLARDETERERERDDTHRASIVS